MLTYSGEAGRSLDSAPEAEARSNLPAGRPLFAFIELLFFAYRDFVGDADRLLAAFGFGRAHHRVVHFVDRLPGMTVAELLDILRITKQSLNRVMKDLLDGGFIEVRSGSSDRRQRHLFVSERGKVLAADLARLQSERLDRALAGLDEEARGVVAAFLARMIEPADRGGVLARLEGLLPAGFVEPPA